MSEQRSLNGIRCVDREGYEALANYLCIVAIENFTHCGVRDVCHICQDGQTLRALALSHEGLHGRSIGGDLNSNWCLLQNTKVVSVTKEVIPIS